MVAKPLLVREDIETTPRRRLFTLFGVPWTATPQAWMSLIAQSVFGISAAIAATIVTGQSLETGLRYAVIWALLTVFTSAMHTVGHILGGLAVKAPMDENLVTASRHVNIYRNNPPNLPGRVHLGRALGGPLMNIAISILGFVLFATNNDMTWLFLGVINSLFGFGSLAPVPSVDGEVIWRELRRK